MDSIPLAERIVRFIRQVDNFLSYDFIEQLAMKTGAPKDEIEAAHERRMDARDAMRDDGQQLAQDLVSAGYDPETVLRFLYCIDRNGGGARTVKRRWPQAKVTLQTLALQLQTGRSELASDGRTEEGNHPRTRGRKWRYDPQMDRDMAEAWQRASNNGTCKKDFAKDKKMSVKDLNRLLNRVRRRKNRAD